MSFTQKMASVRGGPFVPVAKMKALREVAEQGGIRLATDDEIRRAFVAVGCGALATDDARSSFCKTLAPLVQRSSYERAESLLLDEREDIRAASVARGWAPPRASSLRSDAASLRAKADALEEQAAELERIEQAEAERVAAKQAEQALRDAEVERRRVALAKKKEAEAAAAFAASPEGRIQRLEKLLAEKLAGGAA